jgi:DNA polymerase-3 subunit beta
MKFQVERDVLAEAVGWASRALPSRPVIPVLSGLLLEAAADGLTLSCFDYEVSARVEVAAEVAEPGTVLVPGRLLAEITRSLPSLPVEFADDPEGVGLTCGSASFTLVTLPLEEYPDLPELPQIAGTVDGGLLAAAVSQVAPAASRDDTLPMLTGVNIEADGETMTLVATDRYRLAVRDLPWTPVPPGRTGEFLVPARTLADAARTMAPGEQVTIRLRSDGGSGPATIQPDDLGAGGRPAAGRPPAPRGADAMIGFEARGRRLTTRLIAGDYIKYRSRFPADLPCRADMPAGPFTEAVRRVSLVAERGSAVRLSFGAGQVTVEAETQGRARAREIVRADFAGTEPVIAFSPHFLLDGIAAAGIAAAGLAAAGLAAAGLAAAAPHADGSDRPARTARPDAARRPAPGDPAADSRSASSAGAVGALGPDLSAADLAGARIRIGYSTATRPAVITGVRARQIEEETAGTAPEEASDFRYLVVPLRAAGRQ